ncbi:hypothetical protein [Parachitinimonas caeni]|uniref:ArsR family transcriptional regulator n=1 Tax=Parachitinimonas caeni TaxID=3031301 RepID=A0ABT7E2F5_9NEIS|nr:hypothetical protein [Parachitinimonas caeni]MDK2126499.1 hypothetical protein [Parachitinimonas caeni]
MSEQDQSDAQIDAMVLNLLAQHTVFEQANFVVGGEAMTLASLERLVARGLASRQHGKVYTITEAGQAARRQKLSLPHAEGSRLLQGTLRLLKEKARRH